MSYDPDERRDTPLARKLKEQIRREGPISVARYMQACLQDPEHGYYRKQQAIGAGGDFITAPEISQVFGELIGLWCVVVWQQMGQPVKLNVVELGPGRGTLMRDVLRAMRVAPRIKEAASVYLIETSEVLQSLQRDALAGETSAVSWMPGIASLSELPYAATIVLGNEFLDAFPVEQYIARPAGWHVRNVGLDAAGRLQFGEEQAVSGLPAGAPAVDGTIAEECSAMPMIASALEQVARRGALAALFIDYGYPGEHQGETLQAVRKHRYEHPLASPGEADLTIQVDFESFGRILRQHGALGIDGPVTQSEFLGSLGIMERASRLMAANPAKAAAIEAGIARLMSPTGMGSRFKTVGIRSPSLATLPGFASLPNSG